MTTSHIILALAFGFFCVAWFFYRQAERSQKKAERAYVEWLEAVKEYEAQSDARFEAWKADIREIARIANARAEEK